jgi:signal transduction histidine kinase/ActR/RegA family two-component response regulator
MIEAAAGPTTSDIPALREGRLIVSRARAIIRRALPVGVVICLAVGALALIIALQGRTSAQIEAQQALRNFEAALHSVQDIPWTLAQAPAPPESVVAGQLAAGERQVTLALSAAADGMSAHQLSEIRWLLARNFSANEQILGLIAHGQVASPKTTAVNDAGTRANDAIERVIQVASERDGKQASASLTRATIGFSALLIALVVGSLLFYRLSTRARVDRVRRSEAERASLAKSAFLSRVSHELRTPLNSILGFAQIVARSDLDERQRGNIERVRRAGRHLVELINEVLDISRIESGELRVSLEPVRVSAVVSDVIDLVAPLAEARGVMVTADESCAEPWVRADLQRGKQVLLNLISNAVKYNHEGGHVTASVVRGLDDRVGLRVTDDGPGIAPELLDRLFSPFDRLGAEATAVEGTGLGLALAKGFVEAMGGTITVQSTPGVGSAFTTWLVAADQVPSPRREPLPSAARSQSGGRRRKVLYIEDNVSNLDLVDEVFSDRPDIQLLTAVQGSLGITLALEHRPDVVLLDLNLPDISGEKILERLREDPATANTPVIVLTADATDAQRARVRSRGATAYLTKPVDIDTLLHLVDQAMLTAAVENV